MNLGKEILTFEIEITGIDEVKGKKADAMMIHFIGGCNCPLFRGKILPGGVDTQIQPRGGVRTLSARYILEGVDCEGQACKIFVQNRAELGPEGLVDLTIPEFVTDSRALSFLEHASLRGTITPAEKGVTIHIMELDAQDHTQDCTQNHIQDHTQGE